MFSAIADGFNYLFSFLSDGFGFILDGIFQLFKPILSFLDMIFYFIYKLGVIVVKIVALVFAVGRLLVGLIEGLFATIFGFSYSGRPAQLPSSYANAFARLQPTMAKLQLDKVAYILQFGLWLFTAFAATTIIGKMRGGGDDS